LMRLIPNMEVYEPGTPKEFRDLFLQNWGNGNPKYFRLSAHTHSQDLNVSAGEVNVVRGSTNGRYVFVTGHLLDDVLENTQGHGVIYVSTLHDISKNSVEKVYSMFSAQNPFLFSVENPSLTTSVNIGSTVKLFEACIGNVFRVIFASSSSVYGGADQMPTPEYCEKHPKSPYAWHKSSIEDLSEIFCDLYDIDIVCLRYFNVFGPGQYGDSPYSTAVSAWCDAIKNDSPLRSDGDGTQSRDLCYVDNVVHANILAAESDQSRFDGFKGRCYNIACGDSTSNNMILDFLQKRFEDISIVNAPWRAGDVMHTQADISRASEDFEYEPLVRFWSGFEKTLAWWGLN